jgi:hypothetical protein
MQEPSWRVPLQETKAMSQTQIVKRVQEIAESSLERLERLVEELAKIKKVSAEW